MPQKNYDLHALLYELKQASSEGMTDAQDLSRLTALALGHLGCGTASEAYEMLYADWKALPRGTVMSGMRAGQVLSILPMLRFDQPLGDGARQEELLSEAREYGPADERWQANIMTMASMSGLQQLENPGDMEAALARIERARATLPPGSPERDALDISHAGLRAHLAQLGGGEDDFDSAVEDLARLADAPMLDAGQRLAMAGQLAVFRSHQAVRREDEAGLATQIRRLETVIAQLSPHHMDRLGMEANLDVARSNLTILRARRTGNHEPTAEDMAPSSSVHEVRRQISALPRTAQADKLGEVGTIRVGRALFARDFEAAVAGLELLEDAMDRLEPDDERWIRNASALGTGHAALAALGLAPQTRRADHLDQGISWLRHAMRLAKGPEHPLWGSMGISLARAYRLRGDTHVLNAVVRRLNRDASRHVGLDAVRAAAWSVLLQSGTAHAAETARRAGEHATEVARWCLADGAHDDAVRALDAGRGLVLHAATVAETVPDLLTALGQSSLADEWRAAGTLVPELGEEAALTGQPAASGPPSRLRRRVLQALAASPQRRRLLDAPTTGEIGKALLSIGATALVYLVPGEELERTPAGALLGRRNSPGAALIVLADGTTRTIELRQLVVEAAPLVQYRAAFAGGRDAGGPPAADTPPPVPAKETRAELDELCEWAGKVAMRELLEALPRGYGRAPSVVMVPMAELGAVPWHAARVAALDRARPYACQQAGISYMPSARLLCEVAGRPAPGSREALVVGNPTRDLHDAGVEAEAVHRTFYPDGEFLGPGQASPAAVTDWLARQRGGVLHLACHGAVQQGERHSSYLELSGGRLAAEQLTEGAARYRQLDLVVLAACRTNVSGHGYDEAYSLATAFLVAGARSVLGSLWPVPDEATSLLMYMTHHFMRRDGLSPGQALRTAQSWMLDDQRQAPAGMPANLVAKVPLIKSADLAAWAGFTHLGW
ncbi:CHAT domain-containing protein [Streptomyces sp. NPDC058297]|uniref:CHAT domain-containing protein n=1 Tax=Streptomyces sp. NPDC058297 TaxID=3346433 RepID=UPI0036E9E626